MADPAMIERYKMNQIDFMIKSTVIFWFFLLLYPCLLAIGTIAAI